VVWVALGLGSNHEPAQNLASGLDELLLRFKDLQLSSVFRSSAKDKIGPDYLNMVVGVETDLLLQELATVLKKIEDKHRRDRSTSRPASITLDIDILLYADKSGSFDRITLPRPEITTAAYVLWPLAQIAGKKKHPSLKQSYAELWQAFDNTAQSVSPVDFEWHERVISRAIS
jgi:2-amino-4-hydroxy-6-hydroxymethyldihydropteridine diphosphokinase